MPGQSQRAVVIGGSIAGLCSAAALSHSFDEVVVLERDPVPITPTHRKGTPQSKHPHFLLEAGRAAMEGLLPGFTNRLLAAGGRMIDPAQDVAFCQPPGWAPRRPGFIPMVYSSRILLESVLRSMVSEISNVQLMESVRVDSLLTRRLSSQLSVTGVLYTADEEPALLESDLLVDASGRGTRCPSWLEAEGMTPLNISSLNAGGMYSSRWYEQPSKDARPDSWWWESLTLLPGADESGPPEHQYLCTIYPIEESRWIAFMGSWGLDMPKTSAEFEDRTARLRTPVFSHALERAQAISEVFFTRATANVWRRYDLWDRQVAGFIAAGDSVCAFNPLYGQGMSAAAASAITLKDILSKNEIYDSEFSKLYFSSQAKYLHKPWSLAITRDRTYENAVGTEALADGIQGKVIRKFTGRLFGLVYASSWWSKTIDKEFFLVFNAQQSVKGALLKPRVLLALVCQQLGSSVGITRIPRHAEPTLDPPSDFAAH